MLDTSKIYSSTRCGDFKVVSYKNANHVEIEFALTGFKSIASSDSVRRGLVRDKLAPVLLGVGVIGKGDYRWGSKQYTVWRNMLTRCYCPKTQERQPSYVGVTVCSEWHNLQNFAKWFDNNYIDGFQIDKDIKQRGVKNKIYSPETCIFVSRKDNSIEAKSKTYKVRDPLGVVHEVYNMAEFCREIGLCNRAMSMVCTGKRKRHKGWVNA